MKKSIFHVAVLGLLTSIAAIIPMCAKSIY